MIWKRNHIPPMPGHRLSAGKQLLCSVLAGLLLSCCTVGWINHQLDPMVLAVSNARFSGQMERILCRTLEREQELSYDELTRLQYDAQGRLSAVTTACEQGNRLRSRIITDMLDQLTAAEDSRFSIPVGSLSALTFLSGLGWEIPVRLLGVTNVDSRFESSLTAAGINQSLHTIRLTVRAELILLLPGGPCATSVTTSIPMAETVLLGQVPESYSYFSQFDSAQEAADACNDWAAK